GDGQVPRDDASVVSDAARAGLLLPLQVRERADAGLGLGEEAPALEAELDALEPRHLPAVARVERERVDRDPVGADLVAGEARLHLRRGERARDLGREGELAG